MISYKCGGEQLSTSTRILLFREIPALIGLIFFLLVPMHQKQHWALFSVAHLYAFVVTSKMMREKVLANKKYKFSFLKILIKCHQWGESVLTFSGQWPKGKTLALMLMPIVWVSSFQLLLGIADIPWGAILGGLSGTILLQVAGPLDHQQASS